MKTRMLTFTIPSIVFAALLLVPVSLFVSHTAPNVGSGSGTPSTIQVSVPKLVFPGQYIGVFIAGRLPSVPDSWSVFYTYPNGTLAYVNVASTALQSHAWQFQIPQNAPTGDYA